LVYVQIISDNKSEGMTNLSQLSSAKLLEVTFFGLDWARE